MYIIYFMGLPVVLYVKPLRFLEMIQYCKEKYCRTSMGSMYVAYVSIEYVQFCYTYIYSKCGNNQLKIMILKRDTEF